MISQEKRAFSKGFTLAEILLVAGIIALIGSIILIFSKGAIEKARIAKALNFDAQIYHALGAYAIGVWNFDEGIIGTCAGGNGNEDICDGSGLGNHGTINDDVSWTEEGDTPSKRGRALNFDGDGDYVDGGSDSSLEFIDSEDYTYTGWFKSNNIFDINSSQTILDHQCDEDSRGISILIDGETKKLMVFSGVSCGSIFSNSILKSDTWYHFAVVYNGDDSSESADQADIQIYINGSADGSEKNINFWDNGGGTQLNLTIGYNPYKCGPLGCDNPQYWHFNGKIDNIRIYKEALSSSQIKKLYATSSPPEGGGEF